MTATPPRADLRTLAAEAIRHGDHALADDGECGRREDQLAVVDAVLAAVLPEHRRMVLGGAAKELTSEIEWQREKYGDGSSKVGIGRLIGMEDAQATLRRLAAAVPPAGPSATVPAGNAPAVPEEADGQLATEGDALTYAEMEAERDRLAGEVFTLTNSESLDVVAAELERDEARADRDRLAAQVAQALSLHERIPYARESGHFCGTCQETWPCSTVDALSDAGTQPCPTPSDAKSGMVPLADVLNALRDHDGFVDWTRTKGPQGYIDDYVIRQYREACARYLAERFAPTTAPEGEKPWPGLPTPGLHLVTVEDMNTCVRCGKFTGRADCPGEAAPEGADERNGHG